jgi:acetyl-CoA carboxylase carboxyl transferase subunit alpha
MAKIQQLTVLDFEKGVEDIEDKIIRLHKEAQDKAIDLSSQIRMLEHQKAELLRKVYSNLTAWQTVQVARHPQRPIFQDYIDPANHCVLEFIGIHGDRCFGDDPVIRAGFAKIGRHKIMLIGHDKGKTLKEKVTCRFGCPEPEGFRKARRAMELAEKFGLPIVSLVDTPGAHPGIGSEERGIYTAIGENLRLMPTLKTPIICIVVGEGGSGGALGIGVGDKMAMLEYSYFSVISPEGCAAILWREANPRNTKEAARALKITSREVLALGIIDDIILEPLGGAHRNVVETLSNVGKYICHQLTILKKTKIEKLVETRQKKILSWGTRFCVRK